MPHPKRTVKLQDLFVNSLVFSTILQIGDANTAAPRSRAIAVQKEGGNFTDEGYAYESFPIFNRPFPLPTTIIDLDQTHITHDPFINVRYAGIEAASASAIIQLGGLNHLDAETKVKHIRILKDKDNEQYDA